MVTKNHTGQTEADIGRYIYCHECGETLAYIQAVKVKPLLLLLFEATTARSWPVEGERLVRA
jgi:hypothetical protein